MRNGIVVLVSGLTIAAGASAGPLDPPGAPSPSYKTLDQANPGTALSAVPGDADSLHSITAGGRYFLDADIEGAGPGLHAIQINTIEAVEIDFGGFSIRGDGTETLEAIDLVSGVRTVHGGAIVGWGTTAITELDASLTLRNMTMRNISGPALMTLNRRTLIEHCLFDFNDGPIVLDSTGGTAAGILIRACVFEGMKSAISGLQTSGVQILDCVFTGIGSASEETRVVIGDNAQISRCTFSSGGETAVNAGVGLRLSDCVLRGQLTFNPIFGIVASVDASVVRCTVSGYSGAGVVVSDRAIVQECVITNNEGPGIQASASANIIGNTVQDNINGIVASFGSRVVGNILRSNGIGVQLSGGDTFVGDNSMDGDRIVVDSTDNVIDGNNFTDSSAPIELNVAGNVVRRNTFSQGSGIGGTQGAMNNVVYPIRTSVDFLSSGPFDNLVY